MSLKTRIINKAAGAFDKMRPRVAPGERCFLLKRSGQTQRLSVVAEITIGFWVKWNGYREQMQFMLPDDDAARIDQIAQASYIGYGTPDAGNAIYVFSISADQRDRIPPNGASPFWKLFAERESQMRFVVN